MNPGRRDTTRDSLEDCPNPIYAARTDEEVLETTRRLMEKYNITGVVSGEEEFVGTWTKALGERAIPALYVHKAGEPGIERVRSLIERKAVRVIGEVLLQYAGLSPSDPSFDPYVRPGRSTFGDRRAIAHGSRIRCCLRTCWPGIPDCAST
jgi:hypothetical protein